MDAKKKRLEKRIEKALEKTSTIEGGKPSSKKQSNPKKAKNPASTRKVKSKSPASDANENGYDEANDYTPCLFCEIPYNESNVPRSQCPSCKKWLCDTSLVNTLSPRNRLVTSTNDQPFAVVLVDKFLITFKVGLPTYYLIEIE